MEETLVASAVNSLRYTVPLQEILERFEAPRVIDYLSMAEHQQAAVKSFPYLQYHNANLFYSVIKSRWNERGQLGL